MAITRLRLRQFKCFEDSGDIPVTPLTIVFGRNNTGKSSILQSLLLFRQTLDSPEYGPRLDLRGPLYNAGTYADLVHQHRSKENINVEFGLDFEDGPGNASVELEFSADEPQPARLARLKISSDFADPLEIKRGRGRGGPYELYLGGKSQGTEEKALSRFPANGFFPLIGQEPLRRGRPNEKHQKSRMFARKILMSLEMAIRDMRAVGAFRHQPERRYEYQGRSPQLVDATGRTVMAALIEDIMRRGAQRGQLVRSVNQWLKAVGRVRILPFKRISKSARIFEVRVRDTDSGRWANFADVGFGIGQALPVFVEGLRTPERGMFLVQEPEIHLHPDSQLRMADFLVSLALKGRRVFVETHSENLLLRIRRRVLGRTRLHIAPADVSIIFVRKNEDGTSQTIRLSLDEMAQVSSWPSGFMEEATQERMEILKRMRRASSRGQ